MLDQFPGNYYLKFALQLQHEWVCEPENDTFHHTVHQFYRVPDWYLESVLQMLPAPSRISAYHLDGMKKSNRLAIEVSNARLLFYYAMNVQGCDTVVRFKRVLDEFLLEQYDKVGNRLVNITFLPGGGVDWQRFGLYSIITSGDSGQPVEVERFDGVRVPGRWLNS